MNTTLTPPTTPEAPQTPPPARRSSAQVVAILAIAFGGILVLGTIATATLSAIRSTAVHTDTLTADVRGVTGLDVDVSTAELTIAYGDVDEAVLSITGDGGATEWRLTRDAGDLVVSSDRPWWTGWRWFGDDERATLTLPERFADTVLDASFGISAGSIIATGTYDELGLDLSAGSITVDGTARALDVSVSAGRAVLDLADVRTAELDVSAGAVDGRLTGTAPNEVIVEASAGRIDLGLPAAPYAVSSDVSAGDFTHELSTDPSSRNRVSVQVSAGAVHLFPER